MQRTIEDGVSYINLLLSVICDITLKGPEVLNFSTEMTDGRTPSEGFITSRGNAKTQRLMQL